MSWIYENIELFSGIVIGFCTTILIVFGAVLYLWKHDHTSMVFVEDIDKDTQVYECKCCGARTAHNSTMKFPRYCAGCGREVEYIFDRDEGADVTWSKQ